MYEKVRLMTLTLIKLSEAKKCPPFFSDSYLFLLSSFLPDRYHLYIGHEVIVFQYPKVVVKLTMSSKLPSKAYMYSTGPLHPLFILMTCFNHEARPKTCISNGDFL